MPRQVDLPAQVNLTHDPNNQLTVSAAQLRNFFPTKFSNIPVPPPVLPWLVDLDNLINTILQALGLNTVTGPLADMLTALSAGMAKANESFATLLNSWFTTLTTPAQSFSTMLTALDSAWSTYIDDNNHVQASQSATITQLINALFGLNSAGQLPPAKVDGLSDSWNEITAAVAGDNADAGDWGWLADIMTNWFGVSSNAHGMGVTNTNTLGERNNKPLIYGLDDTTESNIAFTDASSGWSLPSGQSLVAFVRCQQSDIKNTISFLAQHANGWTSNVTGVYATLYRVDFANSTLVYIGQSADLGPQLTNSLQWIFMSAFSTAVQPGDVLAVSFTSSVTGTSGLILGGISVSTPAHPTAKLPALAGSISGTTKPGTGAVAFSSITFSNSPTPYVAFEISNPPTATYPDRLTAFTSSGSVVIGSWVTDVDLVALGSGGGGQGELGFTVGNGGLAGTWGVKTLIVGTDIVAGSTITITVGAGGSGGGYYNPGIAGQSTIFSWTTPSSTTQTFTAIGGAGGGTVQNFGVGASPGNETFDGRTYSGGGTTLGGSPTTGSIPGGGGGGGQAFQFGGKGARGQAWTVERQT